MSVSAEDHTHEWQAHGLVREQKESRSPCSTWDDVLYTDVFAVQSCGCGQVKRTRVGQENVRRRGMTSERAVGEPGGRTQ